MPGGRCSRRWSAGSATIAKSLEDAQKARQELERLQRESAEMMRQARVEAESIISRSRSDAEALREELKQKSRAEAAAIVKNAEKQIQMETARAIQQIRTRSGGPVGRHRVEDPQAPGVEGRHEGLIEDTLKQVETRRHV